jgi:uncharacterized protein YbjT (DUF2867 family)
VRGISRSGGDGLTAADVADRDAMLVHLEGVDAAYYLVHSLGDAGTFGEREREAAETFAAAAHDRGVGRLIYLGGILPEGELSPHLASRQAVGETLRSSGVPTVELRASIVVGVGSASFELVRDLVEKLPVIVGPDWLENAAQPIALGDVVAYLLAALDLPLGGNAIYEIGGADRVTYRGLVDEVARQTGGATVAALLPVPSLPLSPSALPSALSGLAPGRARLAANLIESMRHETAVRDDRALRDFDVRPMGLADAVRVALATA